MSLKGRWILITGATGGIGQKMAEVIAELGGNLYLVDKPGSDYSLIVDRISEYWSVEIVTIDCDLEKEKQRDNLVLQVIDAGNGLDVLINNAGFVGTSDLQGWAVAFEQQSVTTWRRAIEVNLTAVFDLAKGFSSLLKNSISGSIINVASIYGVNGPDYSLYKGTEMGNPAAYAASKGGLIQLTRWLATTMAPDVRVNAISPGGVFRNQPAEFVKRYEARTPLGKMANNEDFKGVVAFMATNMSSYMTGQNIKVDGGWTIW